MALAKLLKIHKRVYADLIMEMYDKELRPEIYERKKYEAYHRLLNIAHLVKILEMRCR